MNTVATNTTKSFNSLSNNNTTNVVEPIYWIEPASLVITRLFLEVGIAFFGVTGNILVLLVMTRYSSMNYTMTTYIIDLAIADLGILTINFPFGVVKEQVRSHWVLGEFLCLTLYPLCEVFYGVSIWSITAVAIERYRSIVGTASLVHKTSKRQVITIVISIWLASFFVICFPIFLSVKYLSKQCMTNFSHESLLLLYFVTEVIFWFALPLSVISFTYYKISRRIAQSNEFHQNIQNQLDRNQTSARQRQLEAATKQNSKAKKILTPLVVIFIITMLPSNIFRLLLAFMPEISRNRYFPILYNIFLILSVTNSASNPVIYCMVSKEFRLGVKLIIPECFRVRASVNQTGYLSDVEAHSTSIFTVKNLYFREGFSGAELLNVRKIAQ